MRLPGLQPEYRGSARAGAWAQPGQGRKKERPDLHEGVQERVDDALVNLRQPGEKKPEYSDLVQSLPVRWLQKAAVGTE